MPSNFGSNLAEKYRSFMSRRNGPDQLSRDALILALVVIIISLFFSGTVRTVLFTLGVVVMLYSYFRLFSSKVADRSRENEAYLQKRTEVLGKISGPFKKASQAGATAAKHAKDKDHRYFACPKCHQQVRVPKGAGKIRVTCPKCGEKFERKA